MINYLYNMETIKKPTLLALGMGAHSGGGGGGARVGACPWESHPPLWRP